MLGGLHAASPAAPDPRSASQLRDPQEISSRMLDLDQDFDPALLERMSAWMAVTTGTLYSAPPPTARTGGDRARSEPAPPASLDWSVTTPSPADDGAAAAAVAAEPSKRPLTVSFLPRLLGESTAALGPSDALGGLGARTWGTQQPHEAIGAYGGGDVSVDPSSALLALHTQPLYRMELFDYPTAAVVAQVVCLQAHFRSWRVRRWNGRYRRTLARVTARETATTFQAWQMQAQVTSRHHRSTKRACFHALREYTGLVAEFFDQMSSYLDTMLGQADYSAAAMWKVAQRSPVPNHESLSTVPTFLYSSIHTRLYRLYSLSLMRSMKQNLRYWRSKREAARLLWKRSSRTRTRAVLLVWFRYSQLMAAERSLLPIPTFDETIDEWDIYFSGYMRMASLTRKVASMCAAAIVKRAFRRLQTYLFRAGSRRQMRIAVKFVVDFSQRTCFTTWSDLKNVRIAERFFFRLVFRRWQRVTRVTFQSMHVLEKQLNSWVMSRNMRRCFRALRTYMKYSAMLAYAATRRIRSPFEQSKVLRCVFMWRGDYWHVALVDSWHAWRLFTSRRQAFSTFITRHVVARRREQLLIAFSAFHRQAGGSQARAPLANEHYSMAACEDNGSVEAAVVEVAQTTFADDDLDTALQRHRKMHFQLWKGSRDRSLLKRVMTLQMHHIETSEADKAATSSTDTAEIVGTMAGGNEKAMLAKAKSVMKSAVAKHGSRENVLLHFKRELQFAAEVRRDAQASHRAIIERHDPRPRLSADNDTAVTGTAIDAASDTRAANKEAQKHSAHQHSKEVEGALQHQTESAIHPTAAKINSNGVQQEEVEAQSSRHNKTGNRKGASQMRQSKEPPVAQGKDSILTTRKPGTRSRRKATKPASSGTSRRATTAMQEEVHSSRTKRSTSRSGKNRRKHSQSQVQIDADTSFAGPTAVYSTPMEVPAESEKESRAQDLLQPSSATAAEVVESEESDTLALQHVQTLVYREPESLVAELLAESGSDRSFSPIDSDDGEIQRVLESGSDDTSDVTHPHPHPQPDSSTAGNTPEPDPENGHVDSIDVHADSSGVIDAQLEPEAQSEPDTEPDTVTLQDSTAPALPFHEDIDAQTSELRSPLPESHLSCPQESEVKIDGDDYSESNSMAEEKVAIAADALADNVVIVGQETIDSLEPTLDYDMNLQENWAGFGPQNEVVVEPVSLAEENAMSDEGASVVGEAELADAVIGADEKLASDLPKAHHGIVAEVRSSEQDKWTDNSSELEQGDDPHAQMTAPQHQVTAADSPHSAVRVPKQPSDACAGGNEQESHVDSGDSSNTRGSTMVPNPEKAAPVPSNSSAASEALKREDVVLDHGAQDGGTSILSASNTDVQAMRDREQELLQRLKELGQSNRIINTQVDEIKVKEALEADMKKFVGPDIYERNTYRAKVNEDALMSRVRKDKLFWLYQQAEEALRRHASEVSRTPLPQFDIPTAQLSEESVSSRASQSTTYEDIAAYFSFVKEHLVARSGGLGHQNATENGMLNAELSHLRSRFPSLQSRGSSSRGGIRLGTGQDGRRSREANSREGRTTHAADISQTAEAARAAGHSMGPAESYLYALERHSTTGPSEECSVHHRLSCPECGTSDDIVVVDGGDGGMIQGAVSAISLQRLQAQANRATVEEATSDGVSAADGDRLREAEKRATFGGGGSVGRGKRRGKQVKGLTKSARSRPSTAPLPPLLGSCSSTLDGSSQWEFSFDGSTSVANGSHRAAPKRKPRRGVWKSPYALASMDTRAGRTSIGRPDRTPPSFGAVSNAATQKMAVDGAGLRIPPHLLTMLGDVEDLLDSGDVSGALELALAGIVCGPEHVVNRDTGHHTT